MWVCVHLRVIVNYYNKDPALTTLLANTRSKRLALINAGISRHPDLYNTINIRNRSQSASSIHLAGSGSIKNAPRKLSSGHIQLVNQLPAGGGGRVGVTGGAQEEQEDRCMVCGHAGVTSTSTSTAAYGKVQHQPGVGQYNNGHAFSELQQQESGGADTALSINASKRSAFSSCIIM